MSATTVRGAASRRPRVLMLACIIATLGAVACAAERSPSTALPTATEAAPSWVKRVYPPPGSDALPVTSIQVSYEPDHSEPKERVRLVIDGTDVTTYARITPGQIVYDPKTGPVKLEPGPHTATIRRVTLPEAGAEHRDLGSYTWSFRFR